MPTIRWSDVDWIEAAGPIAVGDIALVLSEAHIADWQEDPEGRFGLAVEEGADGRKRGELVKFYPSL